MTAPKTMGAPHSTMAIHAGSKGSASGAKRLRASAVAEIAKNATSLLVPPISSRSSSFPIARMRNGSEGLAASPVMPAVFAAGASGPRAPPVLGAAPSSAFVRADASLSSMVPPLTALYLYPYGYNSAKEGSFPGLIPRGGFAKPACDDAAAGVEVAGCKAGGGAA